MYAEAPLCGAPALRFLLADAIGGIHGRLWFQPLVMVSARSRLQRKWNRWRYAFIFDRRRGLCEKAEYETPDYNSDGKAGRWRNGEGVRLVNRERWGRWRRCRDWMGKSGQADVTPSFTVRQVPNAPGTEILCQDNFRTRRELTMTFITRKTVQLDYRNKMVGIRRSLFHKFDCMAVIWFIH